jgi:hypothetical protein
VCGCDAVLISRGYNFEIIVMSLLCLSSDLTSRVRECPYSASPRNVLYGQFLGHGYVEVVCPQNVFGREMIVAIIMIALLQAMLPNGR